MVSTRCSRTEHCAEPRLRLCRGQYVLWGSRPHFVTANDRPGDRR